jgi:short-subunit dehydrogenase
MKTVLILGASSDIAKALAKSFAVKKYNILLAGRSPESFLTFEKDLIVRHGVDVKRYHFDGIDYSSHKIFYERLGLCPDVVICAIGYLGDQQQAQTNWDECSAILSSNYTGVVSILNHAANDMEARKTGTIVGISSVAGERGRQSNYFYGSAKAGFTAFLSGLRNRLAKSSIQVLTVKPGFVDTKMTEHLTLPKHLTASPQDVASAVVKAIERNKNVIYVLGRWRWIMLIIKLIPEGIFKKLKL